MKRNPITYDYANELLRVPKKVVENGDFLGVCTLDFSRSRSHRLTLAPCDETDCAVQFLLDIKASRKYRTKITLHTQENEQSKCIFRVDFNAPPHTNPKELADGYVPDIFKTHVGERIAGNHIHYHVQGYESGAWALPIEEDEFPVKSVTLGDYYKNLCDVVASLCVKINLQTRMVMKGGLMFL